MKKVYVIFVMIGISLLSGCCISHNYMEATCEVGEKCSKCGDVKSEPLGHVWENATCEVGEKCSKCGDVKSEPLGHVWENATCESPETCLRCGIEGEKPYGHSAGIGKCNKCGKFVNEAEFILIYDGCKNIYSQYSDTWNNATNNSDFSTLDGIYNYSVKIYKAMNNSKTELSKIREMAKVYTELDSLVKEMDVIINYALTKPQKDVNILSDSMIEGVEWSTKLKGIRDGVSELK